MKKIITTSAKTISDTIEEGHLIINGNSRLFELIKITDEEVSMKPHNNDPGKEGKTLTLPKDTFCKLFHLRNYSQVSSIETGRNEHIQADITGANRFMVK